jgi:hypothetical protein
MPKFRKQSAPATTTHQRFNCPKILPIDPLRIGDSYQLPHPEWPIRCKSRKHRKERLSLVPKTPKEKWHDQESRRRLLALLARFDKSNCGLQKGRGEFLAMFARHMELGSGNVDGKSSEKGQLRIFSRHKDEINRVLGAGEVHDASYIELLDQSVFQDSTIQRVLSKVTEAATDINISNEERTEAAKAIIAFTILHRDRYNVVRSSCADKSDKQSEALMDLIYFYEKMDESISQLACEVYSRLAEIDRLERKIEQKKEEMRKLLKKEKNIAAATAIGSLMATPVIELFIAPGLVGKIYPFYLALCGIVALVRLRILGNKSLANLDDQKFFEAEQEEVKKELDCLALPEPA